MWQLARQSTAMSSCIGTDVAAQSQWDGPRVTPMPCVLIVEDDDDVREFMQLLVSSCGYETMTARDGEEALARMRERRPCMVLLDLQMPRMDGWEFRERQLQDVQLKHIP